MGGSGDEWLSDTMQYTAGIGLLAAALVVSAWLGLWQEQTYRVYGKQWREALFYSVRQGFRPVSHL
jgi:UDP-xylose/UDP-N-acetylglucosamine transporter B4